ncbi:helix-turn-helix domain-containing protein [Mucilaginibacter agri]|nr:helix-turn-helix domain-containing protein [Mucilaginibacter agri]
MYRPYDWLNFMPFVIVILVLTNISLRDPGAIQRALADSSINWFVDSSQAGWYYGLSIAKSVLWLFYTFLQSMCIINFERRRHATPSRYNYRLINWLKIFNITLIVLFSSLLIQRFIDITFISLDFVSDTTMSFILLLTLGFLVANPHILYSLEHVGLNLTIEPHAETEYVYPKIAKQPKNEEEKIILVKQLFTTKKKEEYLLILDDVLTQSRPYLNKGITVKDLSELTGIPAHHLSSLISSEFNLHFQDFINLRRIEYLKSNINDIGWRQLTLEGICWEIGFTSRTTFFRAFIKFTGLSPSEYFNNLKKNRPKAS